MSCKEHDKYTPLPMAQKKCSEVKGEYNNYFDSFEKCIENEADLKKKQLAQ
jgi:hypothetical protein